MMNWNRSPSKHTQLEVPAFGLTKVIIVHNGMLRAQAIQSRR